MFNEKEASYFQLLERAKLPDLMNTRLQEICILSYEVKYKLCPSNICIDFKEHSLRYDLRQSARFHYKIWGLNCGKLYFE